MKRISFFTAALTGLLLATTVPARALTAGSGKAEVYTVTEHIRFNEGTLPLKHGGILLSNFGTETFDPLNKEGKGYIVLLDKETKVLFPATGALNAPKGMAVKDDCLFVGDVGCVVVYNMKQPEQRPVKIAFPEGELFVNDIVALGDFLLVSVTNTGHLYSIDVKDCGTIWSAQRPKPKKVADIPGANGLAEHEGTLYVASYDPNENPGEQNRGRESRGRLHRPDAEQEKRRHCSGCGRGTARPGGYLYFGRVSLHSRSAGEQTVHHGLVTGWRIQVGKHLPRTPIPHSELLSVAFRKVPECFQGSFSPGRKIIVFCDTVSEKNRHGMRCTATYR